MSRNSLTLQTDLDSPCFVKSPSKRSLALSAPPPIPVTNSNLSCRPHPWTLIQHSISRREKLSMRTVALLNGLDSGKPSRYPLSDLLLASTCLRCMLLMGCHRLDGFR